MATATASSVSTIWVTVPGASFTGKAMTRFAANQDTIWQVPRRWL